MDLKYELMIKNKMAGATETGSEEINLISLPSVHFHPEWESAEIAVAKPQYDTIGICLVYHGAF